MMMMIFFKGILMSQLVKICKIKAIYQQCNKKEKEIMAKKVKVNIHI